MSEVEMKDASIADLILALSERAPTAAAYLGAKRPFTWSDYEAASRRMASLLRATGIERGERVAVLLPDGPGVHAALVGVERSGCVAVGIGPRCGYRELEHLLRKSGAAALVSLPRHEERVVADFVSEARANGLPLRHHLVGTDELRADEPLEIDGSPAPDLADASVDDPPLRIGDVFLLNSTSGTTGLPKVVVHDQRRWLHFHRFAVEAGELTADDVFMSVVPAPFGFGIWTSHVTPTVLGAPTVLMPRFDAGEALAMAEQHRVTVLAAVTTQFVMMLNAGAADGRDLSALRVLFTGGERVPEARAAEFEERTGARVLQFYGSNETGAVSRTSLRDPQKRRLTTSGRVIPEMNVRLFDAEGRDITDSGRGQPGCRGPTLSRGYWDDPEANANLIRNDGWMLLGDLVELDPDGTLRVIGRTDDFIIRGGKNISGPAVEEQVATHPAVAMAAAVAMPDETFGERVCVYVELEPNARLDLEALKAHLRASAASKETWPEHLVVVDALPRGVGGKIAKQQLREDAARRAQEARE